MIIQKVFSNIEKESEKLYSILLSEDEVALFSEFQKEFSKIEEFVDTVKKARKYNKHRLTYKELKDLGISVYEPSGMNMNAIDKEILESREAMGKLKKLGKKTAKGVAIGSAIAGGLYLGKKIYDKQKKTKNQPNETVS